VSDRAIERARDVRPSRLSGSTRRRLVHGGLIAVALLYVGILVLAPLIGIAMAAISPGLAVWKETLTSSDATHAYELTLIITLLSIGVTAVFGVVVALVLTRDRFQIGRAHV